MAGLDLLGTEHWTWRLARNQCCLGRIVIDRNRGADGSLASLDTAEWAALGAHLGAYEALLTRLFQPDRYNYMQLGNVVPHVHVHATPRYRTARVWRGVTFTDVRWGGPPWPETASPLDESGTAELAEFLRNEIAASRATPAFRALLSGEPDHGGDGAGGVG